MFSQRIARAAASGTQRITAEVDRLRRQGADIVDLGAGERIHHLVTAARRLAAFLCRL